MTRPAAPRYVCKTCGAESPPGIGYAVTGQTEFQAPAAGCPGLHALPPVTWVDSDGVWHAAVTVTPYAAHVARAAIRAELSAHGCGDARPIILIREGYVSGSLCTRVEYAEAPQ